MQVTQYEVRQEAARILAECQSIASDAFQGKPRITFKVSSRMTRAAGKARPGTGEVMLSLAFFADRANFEKDFRNTVTHEIAHILSPPVRAYGSRRRSSHGPAWKAMHRRLGGTGELYHDLSLAVGFTARRTAPKQRTEASCGCGCGQTMKLGPTQLKRHRAGARYVLKGHRAPRVRNDDLGPEALRRLLRF